MNEQTRAVDRSRLISPFQGAFLHLMFIGIPVIFGLSQMAPFGDWLEFPPPCSIYQGYHQNDDCPPLEKFVIRDMGYRFILHYELAIVAVFVMARGSQLAMRRFHRTLIMTAFLTLLGTAWFQHFGAVPLDSDFFAFVVLNYLLAIAVSVWVSKPTTLEASEKLAAWSFPGMALLVGAAVNAMAAVASVQILWYPNRISHYMASDDISPVVKTTCALATLHSVIHAMILMSLRDIMTVKQLRTICIYKVVLHIMLPLFWLPELSKLLDVHASFIITVRVVLTLSYLCGYLFAGKADNVGSILTSEKED